MKRIALSLLLLTMSPATSFAATVEDPVGLQQLRATAESGDREAMLELGILYEFGYRMQDHNAPALAWYRIAAEAGNAKAGARHDALKAKMSANEIEEANKLYAEYVAGLRKTAPSPAAPSSSNVPAAQPNADTMSKQTPPPASKY